MAEVENIEFKWGKKRGIGARNRDVQFYESFTYDGLYYTLYDNVYLHKEGQSLPFQGKLIKIWENPDKSKKVKILWFFQPSEISKYLKVELNHPNEVFLASGDGVGLFNINPLEAIVGKCNVVCISKDSRNPQPSDQELQKADFVFCRTFNVKRCIIVDEMDEKIAGIDVKFIFNRMGSLKPSSSHNTDVDDKHTSETAMTVNKKVILSNKLNSFETQNFEDRQGEQKPVVEETFATDDRQENVFNYKSASSLKAEENKELKVDEKLKSIEDLGELDERPYKKAKLDSFGKVSDCKNKIDVLIPNIIASEDEPRCATNTNGTSNSSTKLKFKWGKKRGIGARNRDVQFYESFTYDGLYYTLYDNVYLHKEGQSLPFLGKLIKIWENPDKSKKVKILWFFQPSEISKYLKVELNHPNEVFLASGDGVGLFNINPLEAIVGKCNVVCISKDSRNPQPSDQELQKADFVFCRTFNVKRCIIVDEMDEKIAGIDVKFIFNRMGSLKPSSSHNTDVDEKHTSETAMTVNKKVILSNKLNSFETQNFEDRQGEQKPVVEETFATDDRQENVFNYKSASSLKAEENKELKVDEKLKSIEDLGELDERPYKKAKLDSFGKVSDCKNKIDVLIPNIIASEDEPRCATNTNGTSNSSTKLKFKWGKKRGIGARNRDVQFYESFTYDGLYYTLYDNVYLHKEGQSLPFLGKLIKIWENPDKSKKVKILWFFQPSEISKYLKVELNHPNEVFLASGDGVGLFNINPLEAIVGKCNVVCISKDSRNPQPSDQELQKADFVFCRTFNVKRCIIVDEMDEKIAGIDVKFIFNRMGSLKPSSSHNTDVDDKHTSETAMTVNKKVILSNKLNSFETQNFEDRQGEQKPVVEETFATDDRQENVFNYKSASSLKAEENKELKVDEKLKSIEDLGELDERPYKKAKLDSFGKVSDCKNKIDVLIPNIIASEDEPRCATNTNGTSNSSTKLKFKWGKKRGIGARNRDVQFYESFTYDGLYYTLYDNVYLHKEGQSLPFLGKLIKIWENPDKSKKVKILWFFQPSEISKYLKVELNHPNEVFLASGDGVGLFNINPLEAIVGKCNVVCISKDSRNPQPSDQELQKADFVFCRTFNVKRCIIVDEMDEKIAGIDVKFIFNRMGSLKPSSSHNTDVDDKHTSETAMTVNKKVILSNKLNSFETQNFEDRQGEQKPVVEETFATDDRQENVFNYKSASSLKAEDNKELKVDEKLKSIEDLGELDERPYKKAKLDSFGKVSDCKNKIDVLIPNIIASEDEPRCATNTNGTSNSSTKLKLGDDELTKPTCKLPNESSLWPSNDIIKTDDKALEVISRPDFEIGVLELSPSFLSFCLSLATWSSNVH